MITRKTPDQIALMRKAGRVVAEMHECCTRAAKAGASTLDVDAVARDVLERRGARSNFLNYHGFPAVVCTSPNDVIVHGIPSESVVLEDGDILSIDCGAIIEGWHADAAITVPVGDIDDESKRLLDVTRACLEDAIEEIVAGNRLGDIGHAVRVARASPPASASYASTSVTASAPRCTRIRRSPTTDLRGAASSSRKATCWRSSR